MPTTILLLCAARRRAGRRRGMLLVGRAAATAYLPSSAAALAVSAAPWFCSASFACFHSPSFTLGVLCFLFVTPSYRQYITAEQPGTARSCSRPACLLAARPAGGAGSVSARKRSRRARGRRRRRGRRQRVPLVYAINSGARTRLLALALISCCVEGSRAATPPADQAVRVFTRS